MWICFLFLVQVLFVRTVNGNPDTSHANEEGSRPHRLFVFIEGGGNGQAISINSDYRISEWVGARIGYGYNIQLNWTGTDSGAGVFPGMNFSIQAFPFHEFGNSLEVGLGGSYTLAGASAIRSDFHEHPWLATVMLGYRWQPIGGGFSAKVNFPVLVLSHSSPSLRFGFSAGYTF